MKRYILPFLCFSAFLSPLAAQTEVTGYTPGVTTEGITYYLPKTELVITISATKTEYTPGDFNAYAKRYLRLNDVITEPRTEWKLNSILVQARGVPDKEKLFSIRLKPKTVAPLVGMTQNGILLSINAEAETEAEAIKPLPPAVVEKDDLNPYDYLNEEILSAGSTAKMAELTATEIYDVRESRTLLNKGEADFMPKDGEQLRLMIQNLQTQENALLQLFKGKTVKTTQSFRLTCTPEEETQDILFRFSKELGVVEKDNLAGSPVYIRITDLKTVPEAVSETDKKKKEPNDVRYTLPGSAEITIFTPQQEYLKQTFPMGQFGRTEYLGGDLFNKMATTRVYLDPVSGGIRKLEAPMPQ